MVGFCYETRDRRRYLEGASIGQALRLLEREPSATQRLLAAADHCLTAAYQGACPGVDPKELRESVFLHPTQVPPDLAEGGAYAGRAVRYRDLFPGGELKEMLKGAPPAHIRRFMAAHRARGREVYGNPHRGYAGAYLP